MYGVLLFFLCLNKKTLTSKGLALYLDPSADCIPYLVFRSLSGLHGHSSAAIPVAVPSEVSQQALQSSAAQVQSSGSLEAEVAELAGASIEDGFELRHVEGSQQMTPERAGINIENSSSHQHLSNEWGNAATEGEFWSYTALLCTIINNNYYSTRWG